MGAQRGFRLLCLLGVASVVSAAQGQTSGTGGGQPAPAPRTTAEALVQHRQTLRRCAQLPVVAVGTECRRQAQRALDSQWARLQRQRLFPWQHAEATTAVASVQPGAQGGR